MKKERRSDETAVQRKEKIHDKTFLLRNPNGSHTHTSTNTHTGDTDLLVGALQLRQECANLASSGAAERVSKGNSTTLGVDLFLRNTQFVGAPHALRGEGLVDLVDVDIVLGDTSLLQGNRDGLPGTDTHQEGLDTDHAGGDVFADDLLAQTLSGGPLHQQDGSSTVGDLRSITGVDGAILGEGGADLAERLGGDALTDTIVRLDGDRLHLTGLGVFPLDIKGSNLFVEETGFLGLNGLLV